MNMTEIATTELLNRTIKDCQSVKASDQASIDPYDLAVRLDTPVLLADEWATRRQRIHAVVLPGEQDAYVSNSIVEVLTHIWAKDWDKVIVMHRLATGLVCGITLYIVD